MSEMNSLPEIGAAFVLEEESPVTLRRRHVHYKIRLYIRNTPNDTYAVTYILHESFPNSVREVRKPPEFPLEIFSFGDFTVRAEVRTSSRSYDTECRLSAALRAESDSSSPAIVQALNEISAN